MEIKTEKRIVNCEGCKKQMEVIVVFDNEGGENYQTLRDDCVFDYVINDERDKLREELSASNKTWSELVKENKKR